MAADAPAHALAGEHDRSVMLNAKLSERRTMRGDELGQRVRPAPALQRVRVVERLDQADRPQHSRESPHPRMGGGGARAGREQKGGSGIGHERQSIGSKSRSQPSPPSSGCAQWLAPRHRQAKLSSRKSRPLRKPLTAKAIGSFRSTEARAFDMSRSGFRCDGFMSLASPWGAIEQSRRR